MGYYVLPEYWVEGYAEGDAKSAAAEIAISLSTAATANFVQSASVEIACQSNFADVPAKLVFDISPSVTSSLDVSASAVGTFSALVDLPITASAFASSQRLRNVMTEMTIQCMFDASAEFKWLEAEGISTSWTDAPNASSSWVDA